jgi:hypothetical protein
MDHIEQTIEEHSGHSLSVTFHYVLDSEAPWKSEDGHGPVSEWTSRDKRAGEKVLFVDGRQKLYYDYAEAIKIAKRDGWDSPPYKTGTKAQQAERAVNANFEYLRRWCSTQDWYYVGRIVSVDGNEIDACWGHESDSMAELTKEGIAMAREYIDRETTASLDAACRDIATVA